MKKKVHWIIAGTLCLSLVMVFAGLNRVEGKSKSFLRIGDKIIYGQEDNEGPVRKPIVNRETLSRLNLSEDQSAQIEAIENALFENYPDYEETLQKIGVLENQLDQAKDKIEGWGRFKKDFEEALIPILTPEQIAALHPGEGNPPRGKVKIHLNRLGLIELTDAQHSQINAIIASFDSEVPGLGSVLQLEIENKAKIKELEKAIEEADDEFTSLVLAVLTDEQIEELPVTGPPEHAGPPPHVQKKRD